MVCGVIHWFVKWHIGLWSDTLVYGVLYGLWSDTLVY